MGRKKQAAAGLSRGGDEAAPPGGEPVAADDQAVAAGDQPVPVHDRAVIVTEDDQDAPDDQDATAAADDEGDTAGVPEPDLAAFVPAGAAASVELAADLVDDSLEAFVASARQLRRSPRSTRGGSDADTEQLRQALQRCRAFWRHLHSISIEP